MSDTPEPFFHRDGDTYTPTSRANGWWRATGNLHARVMIGLFAHVIEQDRQFRAAPDCRIGRDQDDAHDAARLMVSRTP